MPKNTSATNMSRREMQKERVRQQIVDAAEQLLMKGHQRIAADDIAAEADVARRTVFNHFATIDEIIVAAAIKRLTEFWDTIEDSEEATLVQIRTLGDLLRIVEPTIASEQMQQTLQTIAQWLNWPHTDSCAATTIMDTSVEALVDDFIYVQLTTCGFQNDFRAKLFSATLSRAMIVCAHEWLQDPEPNLQRWQELTKETISLLHDAFDGVPMQPQPGKDDING